MRTLLMCRSGFVSGWGEEGELFFGASCFFWGGSGRFGLLSSKMAIMMSQLFAQGPPNSLPFGLGSSPPGHAPAWCWSVPALPALPAFQVPPPR